MSYQVLARKWRPRRFSEMVGQQHVVRALSNALASDRLHHAYLFAGTRGVGKTTVARIFAKALNCEQGVTSEPCGECSACREVDEGRFVDLIEVDAASRARVDETRDLLDNVQYTPARGRYKVYLIDEVHMFSKSSFNALLKTLEEPPPHVKFLLATTDPQKLPVTVLSRCLQFQLRALPQAHIERHLGHLLQTEGIEADEGGVRAVARAARGSMRDALSLLDQAIAYGAGAVRETEVREMLGITGSEAVWQLLDVLADGDGAALLALLAELDEQAPDHDGLLGDLLEALQVLAVAQVVPDAALPDDVDAARVHDLCARMQAEDVQLYYQIGIHGRRDMPFAPSARSALEMTLLRMLAFRPAEAVPGPVAPAASGSAGPAPAPDGGKAPAAATRAAPGQGPDARPGRATADAPRRHAGPAPAAAQPALPDSADEARPGSGSRRPGPSPQPGAAAPVAVRGAALHGPEWPDVVASLPLVGLSRELASNAELAADDGERIVLRLSPAHAQLRGQRAESVLRDALAEHLQRSVVLHLEIGERDGETPAERRGREAAERRAAAADSMRSDPGVIGICEVFGATVDPQSVKLNSDGPAPEG